MHELKQGSSPRMRGALTYHQIREGRARIIPADAGSTFRRTTDRMPKMDHPRGCGEHAAKAPITPTTTGSSPRMRGARDIWSPNAHTRGIIPADAGSTSGDATLSNSRMDHPRGCGEH